jgi:protein phosphatase inhibitor 2
MSKKGGLKWDEDNIRMNDEESLAANRTKILEPKTPYHELLDDGETPAAFPPKAPAAKAGPRIHDAAPSQQQQQLAPGMDFAALAAAAEGRRQDEPEDDEVERARKFEASRKDHYKIGSLAELRAKAAAMDDDDEEEEEESAR